MAYILLSVYTRPISAEKRSCLIRTRRLYHLCIVGPSGPAATHTKCAGVLVFLVELWSVHSTNWRFFLRDARTSPPLPRVVRLRVRRHEGKALLMRSLIRLIGECFAVRSDVYPSRSATTRCASFSFARSKKGLNFVDVRFSLTAHLNGALSFQLEVLPPRVYPLESR